MTPHERNIEKMKKNYEFIMKMVNLYPIVEEKPIKEKKESIKKEGENTETVDSSIEDDEQKPRFLTDFRKVHKKFHKLKCECPEAIRLVKEFEEAR